MSNVALGWDNQVTAATLTAGAAESALPVTNLQTDQGSSATAWQTPPGVTTAGQGAHLIVDAGASVTWRAFLLGRTNLSTSATVRWRLGTLAALTEPPPTIAVDFLASSVTLPSGWAFSRASTAYYFDSTKTLQSAASNTPRYGYDFTSGLPLGLVLEESRTNAVANPRAEGATAGTPGTMPTGWSIGTGSSGLSTEVVQVHTVQGLPTLQLRIFGTAALAAAVTINTGGDLTGIALGQQITKSVFLRLAAGSLRNAKVVLWGQMKDSTSAVVQDLQPQQSVTASLARYSSVETAPASGSAPFSIPQYSILVYPLAAGESLDLTLDIGCPQLELGAEASSPILPPAGTPAQTTRASDSATIAQSPVGPVGSLMVDITAQAQASSAAVLLGAGYGLSNANYATTMTWFGAPNTTAAAAFQAASGTYAAPLNATFGGTGRVAIATDATSVSVVGTDGVVSTGAASGGGMPAPVNTLFIAANPSDGLAQGICYVRRFAYWNSRLTSGQLTGLALDGVAIDSSACTWDSGDLGGVKAGYLQHVVMASADQSAECARVDINDPANPDQFINIPLAYAGPVWQPAVNADWSSSAGRNQKVTETVTRGGQEYPLLNWAQRKWTLKFAGIRSSEVWADLMELDRTARAGGNVLLIPDPASADIAYETVFGRCMVTGNLGFASPSMDTRSWQADFVERL